MVLVLDGKGHSRVNVYNVVEQGCAALRGCN